jgi:hypothetical protein
MEQVHEDKDLVQAEVWEEDEAVAAVGEAVLVQVPAAHAFVQTVEQESPTF